MTQQQLTNLLVIIAVALMPFTIIGMAILYILALVCDLLGDIFGFSWGRKFRQILDGREEHPATFR